jgi:hypothetical protein
MTNALQQLQQIQQRFQKQSYKAFTAKLLLNRAIKPASIRLNYIITQAIMKQHWTKPHVAGKKKAPQNLSEKMPYYSAG